MLVLRQDGPPLPRWTQLESVCCDDPWRQRQKRTSNSSTLLGRSVAYILFIFIFFATLRRQVWSLSVDSLPFFFFGSSNVLGFLLLPSSVSQEHCKCQHSGCIFSPRIFCTFQKHVKKQFSENCAIVCLWLLIGKTKKKIKWIFKATVSCDVCFSSPNFHDDNSFRTIFLFSRFLRGIFSPTEVWILFSPRARCTQNRRAAESESVFQTVETQGETTVRNEKPKSWQAQQHLCVHWRCLCASVHLTACRHVWVLQKVSVYWCHIVTLLKYPRLKKKKRSCIKHSNSLSDTKQKGFTYFLHFFFYTLLTSECVSADWLQHAALGAQLCVAPRWRLHSSFIWVILLWWLMRFVTNESENKINAGIKN